jgi:hypothetical protein
VVAFLFPVLDVDHLPSHYSLPCGLIAGLLASTTTQPADVIKTRMQLQPASFSNITNTFIVTMKEGGFRTFFVGLVPRATRRTLMASFTWAFYEQVSLIKEAGIGFHWKQEAWLTCGMYDFNHSLLVVSS